MRLQILYSAMVFRPCKMPVCLPVLLTCLVLATLACLVINSNNLYLKKIRRERQTDRQTQRHRQQFKSIQVSHLTDRLSNPENDLQATKWTISQMIPRRRYNPEYIDNVTGLHVDGMEALDFETHLKNPCLVRQSETNVVTHARCLPYAFIAGFPKCGTSDLYERVVAHPEVVPSCSKEFHWWTRLRYKHDVSLGGHRPKYGQKAYRLFVDNPDLPKNIGADDPKSKLGHYAKCFERLTNMIIQKNISTNNKRQSITVDGSPSTFWDNFRWKNLTGNNGKQEAEILNVNHIRHILPNARIIVIVRNPVDRLYSEYNFFKRRNKKSPENFHEIALREVEQVKECFHQYTMRQCIYRKVAHQGVRVLIGLYSVYVNDWLDVFPRNQLLILRTEDYSENMKGVLSQIFKFLDLEMPDEKTWTRILLHDHINRRIRNLKPILKKTRVMLKKFYQKYNENLANILQDNAMLYR